MESAAIEKMLQPKNSGLPKPDPSSKDSPQEMAATGLPALAILPGEEGLPKTSLVVGSSRLVEGITCPRTEGVTFSKPQGRALSSQGRRPHP